MHIKHQLSFNQFSLWPTLCWMDLIFGGWFRRCEKMLRLKFYTLTLREVIQFWSACSQKHDLFSSAFKACTVGVLHEKIPDLSHTPGRTRCVIASGSTELWWGDSHNAALRIYRNSFMHRLCFAGLRRGFVSLRISGRKWNLHIRVNTVEASDQWMYQLLA